MPTLAHAGFDVVVLGARGGIEDGNLTSFLIKPTGDDRYLALDAGTLVNGLRVADAHGAFTDLPSPADPTDTRVGDVLKRHIRGYAISHAHLDHIAGLVIASPDDTAKPIYALPSVLHVLTQHIFNWETWPNFTAAGRAPELKKYALTPLVPGTPHAVDDTAMTLTAFPLSHGGVESTAFLIEASESSLLFVGDTGADKVEHSSALHDLWTHVAGRVRDHRLAAIIIETSYPNDQPDSQLFGHLTPAWLLASLRDLALVAGGMDVLRDLPVVVSHIKFSLLKGEPPETRIRNELENDNDLGVRFIFPEQGDLLHF